jgi:hypothetical protein
MADFFFLGSCFRFILLYNTLMASKRLLKHIIFLMIVMFVADYLAKAFYWYYSLWYFDVMMHFLGGFWVGLFFIYVFYRKELRLSSISRIILYTLAVGVLWEVFEFYVFNQMGGNPFDLFDTTSDLLLDLAGGYGAIFYFQKRIMPLGQNNVQLS